MKKLILFDLDGVLLDSEDNMRQAWKQVLIKTDIGISFEDYFSRIGCPFKDILLSLGIKSDFDEIEKVYMTASFDLLKDASFFTNVNETLHKIHALGVKMGVVTSKDYLRTKAVLKQINIPFVSIQSPCKIYRGKPAPDHLLVAMAEAGEDPSDTIYVGDMETDYIAAKRAGIDYVHAAWGYGKIIDSVPYLNTISDLPGYIL